MFSSFSDSKFALDLFYFELHVLSILFHRDAATVMLSGQIADGFTTILAGELVFLGLNIAYYSTYITYVVPCACIFTSVFFFFFCILFPMHQ